MLPPNALKYLKGHHDGIVFILLATITASGGYAAGGPWVGVAGLGIGGVLYHIRCTISERHRIEMERLKVDRDALKIEAIKARHRDLLTYEQPPLPLGEGSGHKPSKRITRDKGGGQAVMLMDYAPPVLTGVLLFVVLWDLRSREASQFRTHSQHLKQSSVLLQAHEKAIDRFLTSSSSPISLKRLLVEHSDAMSDRKTVHTLAQLIVNSNNPPETLPDDEELISQIRHLESLNAELFSYFGVAMLTGTFAAVLRWPESAALFEEISAKMAADPKRDVGMAITVSRIRRSDLPFSVARPSPAMV